MAIAYVGTPGLVRNSSMSAQANGTVVSASFTPALGELLVVKAAGQSGYSVPSSITNSGTALSWRTIVAISGASRCTTTIFVARVTVSQAMTVTVNFTNTSSSSGTITAMAVVERWSGAHVPLSPNVAQSAVDTTSPFSAAITNLIEGSVITWANGDYNQAGGTGTTGGSAPTYLNGAVEVARSVDPNANHMGLYAAYQTAPSPAAATSFGQTAPTGQSANLVGVELIPAEVPGGMLAAA